MLVETHVHIVAPDQEKYPRRLTHGGLSGWVRDMPAEDLLALMDEAGIDRADHPHPPSSSPLCSG